MTMHMLPAYYTTTNTKRKKKKARKPNPEHEKFLRKHGVHPDQIGSRRTMRAQKRTQSQTNTAELIETMDLKTRRTVNAFPQEIDHHIAFPTRAKLGTIVIER